MSLEARKLSYSRGPFSLRDISLSVASNTILGIGGPNGSGKSTLLKLLYGFYRPTGGEILVDGSPISGMNPSTVSRKMAVVSQEISEPFNFTAGEVVELSGYSRSDDAVTVLDSMESCGISHLRYRPFSELSGGEKRLVMIAASIYQDSEVILMDEPTAFLDVDKEMKVVNIIRKLKEKGKTLVLVLHDINLLYRISDTVSLLKQGEVVCSGPVKEVLTVENLQRAYSVKFRVLEDGGPYRFAPAETVYL